MSIGLSWVSGSWTASSWVTGSWAGLGTGGGGGLGPGDLTTVFAKWLEANITSGDHTTVLGDTIATSYGDPLTSDGTTEVAKFLGDRVP